MATERQLESAHINGAKSRGPKTLEGKRRSSANARKHGLTSSTTGPESVPLFDEILAAYSARLCPTSPEELSLIQQMAFANIRRQEALAAETKAWNRALATHGACLATAIRALAESNELACILRYQTRFNRQYDRALNQLLATRKLRLPNEPDADGAKAPCHDTILPNDPDAAAANGERAGQRVAKRTGFAPLCPRRRCSHLCFFRNEPDAWPPGLPAFQPIRRPERPESP